VEFHLELEISLEDKITSDFFLNDSHISMNSTWGSAFHLEYEFHLKYICMTSNWR
jgi:hypothetical protein